MLTWFLSCLYSAVSLTLVREQRFIGINNNNDNNNNDHNNNNNDATNSY